MNVFLLGSVWPMLLLLTSSPDEGFDKISAAFESAKTQWMSRQFEKGEKNEDYEWDWSTFPVFEFLPKMQRFAEQHAGTPPAFDALMTMCIYAKQLEKGGQPAQRQRLIGFVKERLARDHVTNLTPEQIWGKLRFLSFHIEFDWVVAHLQAILEKNNGAEIRAGTTHVIAKTLLNTLTIDDSRDAKTRFADRKRARDLLYKIKKEYADTKAAGEVDDLIRELEQLQVGMKAPEIVGKDVDGKELRLSQFRGRVVVVDFWGYWCGACMKMMPSLKMLAKEMRNQPFTLLGINCDDWPLKKLKKRLAESEITWRNFCEGGEREISINWNIEAYPALFVIDQKGVIRARGLHDLEAIRKTVNDLLAK